jgi:hypothetical protein
MPKKDLFIDNNITKNFANPLDPEYKKLIQWLMNYDEKAITYDDKGEKINTNSAYLVVSNKLLAEYQRSSGTATSATNITIIIAKLTREGRLVKISNQAIKAFKQQHFTPKVIRKLTCNQEDRDHIPVVLLSDRKYALSLDDKFRQDLTDFPGFKVLVAERPQEIPYAQ